jgi:hypothetical protein
MQFFIIQGKIIWIKRFHLILTLSSCCKDLNLAKLILISKTIYKIILRETYFNFRLQVFCKISVASQNSQNA